MTSCLRELNIGLIQACALLHSSHDIEIKPPRHICSSSYVTHRHETVTVWGKTGEKLNWSGSVMCVCISAYTHPCVGARFMCAYHCWNSVSTCIYPWQMCVGVCVVCQGQLRLCLTWLTEDTQQQMYCQPICSSVCGHVWAVCIQYTHPNAYIL